METFSTDIVEQLNELSLNLEDQSASVKNDLAWQMEQTPAYCYHLMVLPVATQRGMFEQNEQIMGDHADTEESSICLELSAGHTFHTKAVF